MKRVWPLFIYAFILFALIPSAQAIESRYVGQAVVGSYQGTMDLAINSYNQTTGEFKGHVVFSGGLGGEGDLSGQLLNGVIRFNGLLRYGNSQWEMKTEGAVAGNNISGSYTVTQVGNPGSSQNAQFSIAASQGNNSSAPIGKKRVASGNPIEPLSNGLRLSMTCPEIRNKFGEPAPGWDPRTVSYPNFSAVCGGAQEHIWHFHIISGGLMLNNGIGVGSSMQDVRNAFGDSNEIKTGNYSVSFSYNGNAVTKINIDPEDGGEFKVSPERNAKPADGVSNKSRNYTSPDELGSLAGLYWCVAPSWSSGTINLLPNGTYQMNGMSGGHYKAQQGQVHFDGTLKSWNNGVALIENGNLIFRWQNSDGSKQYFAYRKGGG